MATEKNYTSRLKTTNLLQIKTVYYKIFKKSTTSMILRYFKPGTSN